VLKFEGIFPLAGVGKIELFNGSGTERGENIDFIKRVSARGGYWKGAAVEWMPGLFFLCVLCIVSGVSAGSLPRSLDISMKSGLIINWQRGDTPVLLCPVRAGDGWIRLARYYTGVTKTAPAIHRANPGLRNPLRDRRVRIPLELLRGDLRLQAVRRLFPTDSRVRIGYRHWVLDPFGDNSENWKWISMLFCGRDRTGDLKRANPEMAHNGLHRARPVLIPESLLLKCFRSLKIAPTPVPTPAPTKVPAGKSRISPTPPSILPTFPPPEAGSHRVNSGVLEYGLDAKGSYALYRLRRGEALYSAVVVRFTGQLHASQVRITAREIARRSGIPDVTDIAVGHPVKIPLDLLLPRYLPPDDPRRKAWEKERREISGFLEVVHAVDLSGVQIILDAGHGGKDTGAVVQGVWESTYVYDILCRVREKLQSHTRAGVFTTIEDNSRSFGISTRDRLTQDRDQFLLTHPHFPLDNPITGVHLRWYLSNDIILSRLPKKTPRSKTVFVSFHADSLHPSVRGTMIYVPARHLRPNSYQASSPGLSSRREFKNHPTVNLSSNFKARAEASSRHLAKQVIADLKKHGLPVHPNGPIRGSVLRGRQRWVPAVLRYCLAQNAILVETCNMSNPEDRANLMNHEWREAYAQAIVEGIANSFDK